MKVFKSKKILIYYFLFISIGVVNFLFHKNNVYGDTSISEYLINYSGGMTRRGFLGHFFILLNYFTSISLRSIVLIFQISFHLFFLFYLFKLLVRNEKNLSLVDFFCVFSPLFLIYPLAELESLGRKEILIFLSFVYLVYSSNKNLKIIFFAYSFFILPIITLTWELVVLFYPFYSIVFCLKKKCKSLKDFLVINSIFIPSILIFFFIWLNPLSFEGHKIMCNTINILDPTGPKLGQHGCWGSASMLVTATIYFDTLWLHDKATFFNYLRYFIYFIVGFFPIFFTLVKAKSQFSNIFILNKVKNSLLIILLLYIPIPLIFIYGLDWGRWINIVFVLTYILFIFLRENKFIKLQAFENYQIGKKTMILLFFLCCLSWNPKIVLWEDTGSFPLYRVTIKIIKDVNRAF